MTGASLHFHGAGVGHIDADTAALYHFDRTDGNKVLDVVAAEPRLVPHNTVSVRPRESGAMIAAALHRYRRRRI